ncbi:MAG TPA: alpha/beta hydrolase [Candidatus Acidoferrales bacterium]|nr:alpha/beta hydrolase [Candidatus Acidoferrales bacterium]
MKLFLSMTAFLLFSICALAQQSTLKIWNGLAPGTENRNNEEKITGGSISNVYQPELTVFLPQNKIENCPAVLVFPGGGYTHLAFKKEGIKIGEWLSSNGIAAFVLKYRLNPAEALQDAQRAMSLVRARAKDYSIDPGKIGVIGFSAGGHLAANLVIHNSKASMTDYVDSVNCKPNFAILIYPYLGEVPGFSTLLYESVDKDFPPTFIVHASDDNKVPVQQSIDYYTGLHKAGVSCELHIFEKGGHGFALEDDRGPVKSWALLCIGWLKINGILLD